MKLKKIALYLSILSFMACAELQTIADQTLEEPQELSEREISSGLKQALQNGIDKQVAKLTQKNGFYKNDEVKILLPEELRKVDEGLRKVGMGDLADEGLKLMNRAAEDAVRKATPIFIDAIRNMSITDARKILMGDDRAATNFLEQNTSDKLYQEFYPVVDGSFQEVGADRLWSSAIDQYNKIPFQENVDPDLSQYVTRQSLDGVFKSIAREERAIRQQLSSRTTALLQRVFKLQDR